jgi:hypothetical protein
MSPATLSAPSGRTQSTATAPAIPALSTRVHPIRDAKPAAQSCCQSMIDARVGSVGPKIRQLLIYQGYFQPVPVEIYAGGVVAS